MEVGIRYGSSCVAGPTGLHACDSFLAGGCVAPLPDTSRICSAEACTCLVVGSSRLERRVQDEVRAYRSG
jgi:hypothetical protein